MTQEGKAISAKRLVPLVGRAEPLDEVLGVVDAARGGCGGVVVVRGEAGVGKTRLCHEVRGRLDRRATQVLAGRAGPDDAAVAFSALGDSLRIARRSEPALWAVAAARADVLAAMVPELAGKDSVSSTLVDRPVVFETLLDVVEEAAIDRVTVWFLEDVHWSDPATWSFVEYTARRVEDMALVLVATIRDEDVPLDRRRHLLELGRGPGVTTVSLGRLGEADTRSMILSIAPALAAPAVERVVQRSAGNPLLVEELLAIRGDATGGIPDIVRAAVRGITSRLAPDDLAVLEVAAALGPRFEVELLMRTAVIDPSRSREQLTGGGLLVASTDVGADELGFWHLLVWEAVYQDIPLPRRRHLHTAIAAALDSDDVQPEVVARHHELAQDPEAALDVLLAARKAAAGNVGRAGTLARAALDLAGRHPGLADRVAELARLTINDLFLAGRWTELEPLVRERLPERHLLPSEARAWLANVTVMDLLFLGAIDEARSIVDDEVAHVETASDSTGAGLLFAQAAFLAYFSGDFGEARRWAGRAVEIAHRSGDAEATTRARLVEILARRRLDRSRLDTVAALRANAEFARSAGLGVGESNALFVTAYMTLAHEDFAAAETVGAAAGTWYGLVAHVLHGFVHLLEGRADQAEALLAKVGPEVRHGMPTLGFAVDVAEAHMFLHRGELDHARQRLERPPSAPQALTIPMLGSGHAGAQGWLAWEEDRLDDAAVALAESLDRTLSGGGYDVLDTGPLMLPLQVDTLVRLGRPTELRDAIERCVATDPMPDRFSAAAVAAARFRFRPSPEAASAATRAAAGAPWPWLEALIRCWRGELLADAAAAAVARDQFESIGAIRGVQRAEALLRHLGQPAPQRAGAGTTATGGLSPRELEVAALVAQGLTNSAIAARLFVSRATVSSHVTHILTKLGFSSRTQIAAWIVARGDPT
jgi:DNA-binding CsgD family transcriptional regulator